MQLGYIILYVPKVTDAVTFYEKAFGIACRFLHESKTYAELETGATALAFCDQTAHPEAERYAHLLQEKNVAYTKQSLQTEIAFVYDDANLTHAAYERAIQAGATPIASPTQKPWGQTVSYVRDPWGILVEICSKIH